jgi:hypothetical protein
VPKGQDKLAANGATLKVKSTTGTISQSEVDRTNVQRKSVPLLGPRYVADTAPDGPMMNSDGNSAVGVLTTVLSGSPIKIKVRVICVLAQRPLCLTRDSTTCSGKRYTLRRPTTWKTTMILN